MVLLAEKWETRKLELSDTQIDEFTVPNNTIEVTRLENLGDGYVPNQWPNRETSGCAIQKFKDTNGEGHHIDIVPVNNVLLQNRIIYARLIAELDRNAGQDVDPSSDTPGELHEVHESRIQLTRWLDLTDYEKRNISGLYGRIASERRLARNDHNKDAGQTAAKMEDLKDVLGRDNPGAIAAQAGKLEKAMTARIEQILNDIIGVTEIRIIRLMQWLMNENIYLSEAGTALDSLLRVRTRGDEVTALGNLKGAAHGLRYRHQPFNHMAYALRRAGSAYHIGNEAVVKDTQAGMEFERHGSYLLSPFRIIAAAPINESGSLSLRDADEIKHEVEARSVFLQAQTIGGAYKKLIGRLTSLTEATLGALDTYDGFDAQEFSERAKRLINFHVLHTDEEKEIIPWYRFQL